MCVSTDLTLETTNRLQSSYIESGVRTNHILAYVLLPFYGTFPSGIAPNRSAMYSVNVLSVVGNVVVY